LRDQGIIDDRYLGKWLPASGWTVRVHTAPAKPAAAEDKRTRALATETWVGDDLIMSVADPDPPLAPDCTWFKSVGPRAHCGCVVVLDASPHHESITDGMFLRVRGRIREISRDRDRMPWLMIDDVTVLSTN
jgi:hypothetical protein